MPKNWYAVRRGRVVAVFDSWGDASDQVLGYSKAAHTGCRHLREAVAFVAAGRPGPVRVHVGGRVVCVEPSGDVDEQLSEALSSPPAGAPTTHPPSPEGRGMSSPQADENGTAPPPAAEEPKPAPPRRRAVRRPGALDRKPGQD